MSWPNFFLYCCLSFIFGILLTSFFTIPHPSFFLFFLLIILGLIFRKKRFFFFFLFSLFFFFGGVLRFNLAQIKVLNDELWNLNNLSKTINFEGVIIREPEIKEKNIRLVVKIEKAEIDSFNYDVSKIRGLMLLTVKKDRIYRYGDRIKFLGKPKTPKSGPDFNWRDWLIKEGIFSEIYFPQKIEIVSRNNANKLYYQIILFKDKFRKTIESFLPSPQDNLLLGIILGDQKQISSLWQEKLNITGTRHIIAVSGMNITILINILMALFLGMGITRKKSFFVCVVFIIFYLFLLGFMPSALRAAIMGIFILLAQFFGRISDGWRPVVFSLVIMLFLNPFLLRYDVGFQLSFLAVSGIIFLSPVINSWLKFLPQEKWWNLREILAITFSAQIFTTPLLIYNFGYISIISPLTNALIEPLLPYLMAFGVFLGSLGIILKPIGYLFSLPCLFLSTLLIFIINNFSCFEWAYKTLSISANILVFWYLFLFLFVWYLQKKFKKPFFLKSKKYNII